MNEISGKAKANGGKEVTLGGSRAEMALTEFHTLHTASNAARSLKHSDIREALLQKGFGCSQASQTGTDHYHARLSPSPQATTERVIRTVATGFTTLHTVRTRLLGTCREQECHSHRLSLHSPPAPRGIHGLCSQGETSSPPCPPQGPGNKSHL